jgi:hypothetical protein
MVWAMPFLSFDYTDTVREKLPSSNTIILSDKHTVRKKLHLNQTMCIPKWLTIDEQLGEYNALKSTGALESFLSSPFCPDGPSNSKEGQHATSFNKDTLDRDTLDLINTLFDMVRYTMYGAEVVPKPSEQTLTSLPPCTWDSVQFTHASPQLYSFNSEYADKIRLLVTIHSEVDVYSDQLAYSMSAVLNNSFGFLGLYLGIGVLETVLIVEKLAGMLWKDHLLKETA